MLRTVIIRKPVCIEKNLQRSFSTLGRISPLASILERKPLVSKSSSVRRLVSPFSTRANEGILSGTKKDSTEDQNGTSTSSQRGHDITTTVPLSKPLANWTKEEVQAWFLSSDLKEFASRFPLSGMHLVSLTEAQFKSRCPEMGDVIYNAVQALKGEKDLGEIIDEIYKRKPEWKCILDVPEKPRVDVDLKWVGRETELAQLKVFAMDNISSFLLQTYTKQRYPIPLVHGGLGVGKSRLVVHSNRAIEQYLKLSNPSFALRGPATEPKHFTELFGHVGHIFIDFSVQDALINAEKIRGDGSLILGLRVASHFFFGVGSDTFLREVGDIVALKKFTFENVIHLISTRYATQKQVLLTLQLDEFSHVPLATLRHMVSTTLGSFLLSGHELRVCIVPQLSGTSTEIVNEEMKNYSKIIIPPLLLSPLAQSPEMTKLIESSLKGTGFEDLLKNSLFLQVADSLGGVPRFLQFFVDGLRAYSKELQVESQVPKILRSVVRHYVVDKIRTVYFTKDWKSVLGGSLVGIRTLVSWALSGRKVQLTDVLNGTTVEAARNTGVLLLEEKEEEDGLDPAYVINMPLVLLRALNLELKESDIPDEFLDSTRVVDDREFEKIMGAIRVLRQNLLVGMGKKTARYRDLYPHALGYHEDLDQEIPIRKLSIVEAAGSTWREAIHRKSKLTAVAVNKSSTTINLLEKGYYVHNVPKSSSVDALIVHSTEYIEGDQKKSSGDITSDKEPGQFLEMRTIHKEFQMTTDKPHLDFYFPTPPPKKFNLFIISNKPLRTSYYDEIKKQVKTTYSSKNQLPLGVSVICNQNFKQYAAAFAHRGLYIHSTLEPEEAIQGHPSTQPKKRINKRRNPVKKV